MMRPIKKRFLGLWCKLRGVYRYRSKKYYKSESVTSTLVKQGWRDMMLPTHIGHNFKPFDFLTGKTAITLFKCVTCGKDEVIEG